MKMEKFLEKSNILGILIALVLGVLGGFISSHTEILNDKVVFFIGLVAFFSLFCFMVEKSALRSLRRVSRIEICGNPLLGTFFLRSALLIVGAFFVYGRIALTTLFEHVVFSLLVYFFISGLFETHRLLRR